MEKPEQITQIVRVIRGMHGFLIASHFFKLLADSEENELITRLLSVAAVFFHIGTILYQQYYVLLYPPSQREDKYVFFAKSWMMLELFVFYSLIVNAAVFLAYIQFRGALGYKKCEENANRYKFDALDYYGIDIEWCSFQTVPMGLCLTGYLITSQIGRHVTTQDTYLLGVTFIARFVQFVIMSPFRD